MAKPIPLFPIDFEKIDSDAAGFITPDGIDDRGLFHGTCCERARDNIVPVSDGAPNGSLQAKAIADETSRTILRRGFQSPDRLEKTLGVIRSLGKLRAETRANRFGGLKTKRVLFSGVDVWVIKKPGNLISGSQNMNDMRGAWAATNMKKQLPHKILSLM